VDSVCKTSIFHSFRRNKRGKKKKGKVKGKTGGKGWGRGKESPDLRIHCSIQEENKKKRKIGGNERREKKREGKGTAILPLTALFRHMLKKGGKGKREWGRRGREKGDPQNHYFFAVQSI